MGLGLVFVEAFGWGALSAVSAVLGAFIGTQWKIRHKHRAALMAFGAGALLFATTNELFAEALFEYRLHKEDPAFPRHGGTDGIAVLISFGMIGAIAFSLLNKLLERFGAAERKRATLVRLVKNFEKGKADHLTDAETARVPALGSTVVIDRRNRTIESTVPDKAAEMSDLTSSAGNDDGPAAPVGGAPHGASAHEKLDDCPRAVGAAIYLGLLVDALPESFIIGVMTKEGTLTAAFMVGVFISNFPEAMSSADLMMMEGHPRSNILVLWWGLVFVTALGAGIGAVTVPSNAFVAQRALEGLGGGAMLAVITSTMIPEAFDAGGARVGLAAVAGFLVAVLVSVIFD